MAISQLKIQFSQNFITGSTISFNFKDISTGIETPVTFTWVNIRTEPYKVQRILPITGNIGLASAQAFLNAFEIDEPTFLIELTSLGRFSHSVLITSLEDNITFSGGVATYQTGVPANVTFEITRGSDISIVGLENNNYFINNEVWINLSLVEENTRYEVKLTNLSNSKYSNNFVLSSFNGKAKINLQPILKSLFDYPDIKNANKFKIEINCYNGSDLIEYEVIYKNFIRGGKRTTEANQSIPYQSILRPSLRLPIWTGFETNEYYLDNDGSIQIRPLAEVPSNKKDYKIVRGCDNVYFKFLNQYGGYSNWLFQTYSTTEKNSNLGAFVRDNKIEDLGNEVDNTINIVGKVEAEYYGLIQDLFVSPEIYYLKDSVWVRVLSNGNTTELESNKRNYNIKGKFIIENRFNPSLLW